MTQARGDRHKNYGEDVYLLSEEWNMLYNRIMEEADSFGVSKEKRELLIKHDPRSIMYEGVRYIELTKPTEGDRHEIAG